MHLGSLNEAGAKRARRLRHLLIAAAIAVPLVTLLALEFRALSKLEETAALAQRMSLRSYGKAVVRHVDELYQGKAREALALSVRDLHDSTATHLESHFAGVGGTGVRHFFVARFAPDGSGPLVFFDAEGRALAGPAEANELRAVNVALAPWRVVAADRSPLAAAPTEADESDPEARIVLRPVLDAESRVAGVVGFIVDSTFVRERLLPEAIETERTLFPSAVRDDVAVELRPRPEPIEPVVLGPAPGNEVDVAFRLVFADQALHVQAGYVTPEQWARQSLWINLGLSLAMTAVLVSAIGLALRSAARATKLSQMKTEFVSNVSHELRTPLSSIQIFAEFLRRGRVHDAKKVEEYGASIEAETRRLSRLVENLLDFSRIESGRKLYRREPVAAEDVVAEALDAFELPLQQAGMQVQVRAAHALPALSADRAALVQVVGNLIENAIKYARDGGRLEIDLARDADCVTISVRDAGPGIPASEHERIFEKFYRVSTGLVHDAQGSGLGLAIVKHVVEAHGGQVEVQSREGEGSRFLIRLPVAA